MSTFDDKKFDLTGLREKARASRDDMLDIDHMYRESLSWKAVSQVVKTEPESQKNNMPDLNLSGKVLRGGKYANENLSHTNFSGADLKETIFTNADLQGVDFSGADLSGADLSGANLNGAVFSGAKLRGTNFTGAKMNGVLLIDADIQDAILLDVEMDNLALEELQALVEFLAVYYPHKLNLTRMNLTLLDFSKIDLSRVNLRGVDFTGVDFTGVNIFELDLSECVISPEQIAQALGRTPTPLELSRILAPKHKKKDTFKGIDMTPFFQSSGEFGVWDATKHPGIAIKDLLAIGKKIYTAVIQTPEPRDDEILAKFHEKKEEKKDIEAKEHNAEVRKIIEERKKEILEKNPAASQTKQLADQKAEHEQQQQQERQEALKTAKEKYIENRRQTQKIAQDAWSLSRTRGSRERS